MHVDDLVGHVTQHDDHDWTILNLPAIAPEGQVIQIGSGLNHGRKKGDLLHPEREDQAVLDELRINIGSAAFEAQYQQQPVPPSGNMIKRDWLSNYPYLPEVTEDDTIFQSWDTASKTGPENDWSAGTTWLHSNGLYYLIDVCREKLNYPDLKAKMISKAEEYDPRIVLIEDAGVGTGLLEDLRREGVDAAIATKDKVTRAHIQTPKFESRRVLFPNSAPRRSALEAELLAFPSGRHDDQVDSITQALAYDVPIGPSVVWI
jgi:predicted phage terminase large subunit-like protein